MASLTNKSIITSVNVLREEKDGRRKGGEMNHFSDRHEIALNCDTDISASDG